MVEFEITDDHVILEVKGLHQLWALKRRIQIEKGQLRSVRHAPEVARGWWKGLRLGGTHIPGVLTAGTFYYKGEWIFFDVRKAERAVVIELEGHRYDRLVIEFEDPEVAVRSISEAAGLAD